MKRKLIWSVIIIALISLISVTSIMIYNQEYVRTNINDINFDRVKKIKIGNTEISGTEARTLFKLKSAKFDFEMTENSVKFSV